MRLDLLIARAADLGLAVEWADLGEMCRGEYRDDDRLIVLSNRLTRPEATATLAHELGHAHYGDRCSTARVERRAWAYGARLVIDQREYAQAERIAGPHRNAIAAELGVTPRLVEAWQAAYAAQPPTVPA